MDHLVSIRVVMYMLTCCLLFAIGFKMVYSTIGMMKCEFRTALRLLAASMFFFGMQFLGWSLADTVKEITDINPLPINIATSISAVFVVVAMLVAMWKIEKYLGDEDE